MICTHCRTEIADTSNFCSFCGARQRPTAFRRRLMRSTVDSKLAGVCGGIAEYLDVDSTLVRVIWALAIFLPFPVLPAIIGYLLAWLHPDKSPRAWPIAFATRVIAAWRSIDGVREDESPPVRPPVSSRSGRSHRMAWIPFPVEATRKSRHTRKVTRFVLLGFVIVGVALTTGVFSNQISQLVSATSLFAVSPASRSVFSLDR